MTNTEKAQDIVKALAACGAIPHQTLDCGEEDVIAIVSEVLARDQYAWLKNLLHELGLAFPSDVRNKPTVFLGSDDPSGVLAIGVQDGDERICIGVPDETFAKPAAEFAALVALENNVRKGRKLDVTFYPPAIEQVEWNCTACGDPRLDCKCAGGPQRFPTEVVQ